MYDPRPAIIPALSAIWLALLLEPRAAHAQDVQPPQPAAPAPEASAPRPPAAPQDFRAGYDPERGAYISTLDGRWELNPYGMVQLQHVTLWQPERATQSGFVLRAVKLILHGHVLSTTVTYHLQLNAGDGKVVAEDVYVRWDAASFASILIGQNEVPFNRQHITLEAYQQFVERSSVDTQFNLHRDIGAQVQLNDPSHVLEWTNGIWNGAGQNSVNDNGSYLLTSRLAFNPWGPIAFREADLADSAHPMLSIALAGAYDPARVVAATTASGAATEQRHSLHGVFETTLRYRGASFSTETHVRSQTSAAAGRATVYGQLVQLGVFLIPEHGELVGRLGLIGGDVVGSDTTREISAGANWYLHAHRFKLQADYSNLRLASGAIDNRARLQIELFL
jgi:phosphate-selective porin OprO and OprP